MRKGYLRVHYKGQEVNIVSGLCDPQKGYLFKLANDRGYPIILDSLSPDLMGHVSAWSCIYSSQESADEIFRRVFGLCADDALDYEMEINKENIALVVLVPNAKELS